MRKVFTSLLIACILVTTLVLPIHAYNLTGYYVANMSTQYAWGSNMTSTSIIKTGWQNAVSAWNNEGMNIGYNSNSRNLLESRYNSTGSENGMSIIDLYSSSPTVKQFVCYMNSAKGGWTSTTAKSTGIHELGHVVGLDHVTGRAIMDENRDRTSIYTVQTDDRNGFNAIYY